MRSSLCFLQAHLYASSSIFMILYVLPYQDKKILEKKLGLCLLLLPISENTRHSALNIVAVQQVFID